MIILFHVLLMWMSDSLHTTGNPWLIAKGNILYKKKFYL